MEQENNKTLELKDFAYLMLANLAINSPIIDFLNPDKKSACLPVEYKQIIQIILCTNDSWRKEFSVLIDIREYFENHFEWESKLARTIKQVLIELGKEYEYDFEQDRIVITFTKKEISKIMENYNDEEINDKMNHFTNLLSHPIFERRYQEANYNYNAEATKTMRAIRENKK